MELAGFRQEGKIIMNWICVMSFISNVAMTVALILIIWGRRNAFRRDTKIILTSLGLVTFLSILFDSLEWCWGVGKFLEFEDLVTILEPILWLSFFYTFLQEISERELRAEETLFRKVLDAMPVGVWIIDKEERVVRGNPASEMIVGEKVQDVTGENIKGRGWWRNTGKEIDPGEWQATKAVREGVTSIDEEIEIERMDGSRRILLSSAIPIRDEAGRVSGAINVFQDITERREAELLRMSLFDLSIDMLTVGGFDGYFKQLNPAWTKTLGWEVEELLSKPWIEFVHPEDRERTLDAWHLLLTGEKVLLLENRYVCKKGIYRWLSWNVATLREKEQVFGVVRDITERKNYEKMMEERIIALTQPLGDVSSVRFEDLFNIEMIQEIQDAFAEATGVASIITDTQGRPITKPSNFTTLCSDIVRKTEKGCLNCMRSDAALGGVNPRGPVMQPCMSAGLLDGGTGISVGDRHIANWLIGQVLDEDADLEKIRAYAKEIGANQEEYDQALAKVHRMSKKRFEKVCQALFLIARQLSMLALQNVQQARDITRRKQAEQEILELNAELERRVRNRTEGLEAINKELEAFSYSVSHDLRAPLRAIVGFSQMLADDYKDKLDDQGKDLLRRVVQAGKGMGDLIEALLTLSRLSRKELKWDRVDLSELAETVTQEFRQREPERHVEVDIEPDLFAYSDQAMLRAVFENLIGNAWKFTRDKDPAKIEIGSTTVEGQKAFFVRDNGAGFDMAYVERLFKAFSRLHRQEEFSGTGIGLATVQRIVHRHGGKVWASGEVGKGATFYFTLDTKEGINVTFFQKPC
jgi:PAS domain S-box-containing protein